jgi:abortive infection bacteriophage resistance protein
VPGKCFTSYADQITILINRGLSIPNHQEAIRILSHENYYRLINGYKDLFLATRSPSELYIPGAALAELHALYKFDEELRSLFLRVFLVLENRLKAYIAYEFSKVHGACKYLDANNYNYIPRYRLEINKLIGKIQDTISEKSQQDKRLQHYQKNHNGDIPLWVIINLLTLGNVSRFFKYMQPKEQNEVARRFPMQPNYVNNYYNNITLARNICAHGERFFNFKFTTQINILPEHIALQIPFIHGVPEKGAGDMFAVLLMVKYLLADVDLFDRLKTSISQSLQDLQVELQSISIKDVMKEMGYPSNWMNV